MSESYLETLQNTVVDSNIQVEVVDGELSLQSSLQAREAQQKVDFLVRVFGL